MLKNIPNGEYEVEIFLLTLNASPQGAEFLDFNLLIRSDVLQPQQGTHVHVPLWRNQKNNSYDLNMMTVIAEACGIPDNLVFANLDEVIRAFQGRYVRVKLITKGIFTTINGIPTLTWLSGYLLNIPKEKINHD